MCWLGSAEVSDSSLELAHTTHATLVPRLTAGDETMASHNSESRLSSRLGILELMACHIHMPYERDLSSPRSQYGVVWERDNGFGLSEFHHLLGVRRVRRSMPRAVASVRVPRRDVQPLALYIHGGALVQEHAGTFHLDLQVPSYIISCIMSTRNA